MRLGPYYVFQWLKNALVAKHLSRDWQKNLVQSWQHGLDDCSLFRSKNVDVYPVTYSSGEINLKTLPYQINIFFQKNDTTLYAI
jgi:hypothetical protein